MPKSKRNKIVSLTKTEKKGRSDKEALVEQIKKSADEYKYIYVFSVDNMRNTFLKDIRNEWKTSRFYFGRNKVMAKALGTTPEEEYKDGLSEIAKALTGNVGLLFTNVEPEDTIEFFKTRTEDDYARSGVIANQTVVISEGPVMRGEDPFPHNMESQLRALGMPTILKTGVVTLTREFTICKEGEVLNSQQTQLLKLFYHQLAEFRITLTHRYQDGKVIELATV